MAAAGSAKLPVVLLRSGVVAPPAFAYSALASAWFAQPTKVGWTCKEIIYSFRIRGSSVPLGKPLSQSVVIPALDAGIFSHK